MLIIADKKIPEEAKTNLQKYGELALIENKGITEEGISGHPDVFICDVAGKIIAAPNLPLEIKKLLSVKKINFIEGNLPVGLAYPDAAHYNAVVANNVLIHRSDITDVIIIEECRNHKRINVHQGFTRCSLLPLSDDYFITSDEGINKILTQKGFTVLYVSPKEIVLPGHPHGFFGGSCGVLGNKFFILGSLNHYSEGEKVKHFATLLKYQIIELYDGPLFDGGGLLFIK